MTPRADLVIVTPETTADDCMVIITGKRIRHLPVFDGNAFVGLVSIGDLVKSKVMEQERLIEQLSDYIAGKIRLTGFLAEPARADPVINFRSGLPNVRASRQSAKPALDGLYAISRRSCPPASSLGGKVS